MSPTTNTAPPRPKPKSALSTMGRMLIGGCAGYGIAVAAKHFVPEWFNVSAFSRSDALALLVALPFAYVLTIAVHELGHLAAAIACGFRFRALTIGPFSLLATAKGMQIRSAWSAVAMIGGQQISAPPPGGGTPRQYLVYLAGGGVANIVAGIGFAALAYALPWPPLWISACLLCAAMNLFLGPLNLLPLSTGNGIRTDGYNIRTLLRGGDDATRFRAVFELIGHMFSGVRPREWRAGTLHELLMGSPNALETAMAHLMALQVAMDHADTEGTRAAVDRLVAHYADVPAALHGQFAVEMVTAYALFLDDAESAARYGGDVNAKSYLISPATICRSRAAVALAQSQPADCALAITSGRAALNRSTTELDRAMDAHWFDEIERRLGKPTASMPTP